MSAMMEVAILDCGQMTLVILRPAGSFNGSEHVVSGMIFCESIVLSASESEPSASER